MSCRPCLVCVVAKAVRLDPRRRSSRISQIRKYAEFFVCVANGPSWRSPICCLLSPRGSHDRPQQVEAGGSLVIRNLTVRNDGWVPMPLTEAESGSDETGGLPEAIRVRGFRFDKKDCHCILVAEGERCALDLTVIIVTTIPPSLALPVYSFLMRSTAFGHRQAGTQVPLEARGEWSGIFHIIRPRTCVGIPCALPMFLSFSIPPFRDTYQAQGAGVPDCCVGIVRFS